MVGGKLPEGVLYMLVGDKHAVQLAVSLMTLREHYDGPIVIVTGDQRAEDIAETIRWNMRDDFTTVFRWDAPTHPRGIQYANKTMMGRLTPFERTVFVDADTMFADTPERFFAKQDRSVYLTQFADWVSTGNKMSGRIREWLEAQPELAKAQLESEFPAINTGVISWGPDTEHFFDDWRATTLTNVRFICDEIAAQLIFPRHDNVSVLSDKYNRSPIYGIDKDPVIWHGHGWKFMKHAAGRKVWMPKFAEALRDNFGGLRDWFPASDRKVKRLIATPETYGATREEIAALGIYDTLGLDPEGMYA